MPDKSEFSFAVVRFNERTYQSGGVVAVIRGVDAAQRRLKDLDWCQSKAACIRVGHAGRNQLCQKSVSGDVGYRILAFRLESDCTTENG
jgi:hypothetical protein